MPASKKNKKNKAKYAGKLSPPSKATTKAKNTTPTYMKFFYGFMLVVLLMGSLGRILKNRQTATPTANTPTPASTGGDPNQVVRDFLTDLEKDPTGQADLPYLSLELRDSVASGSSVQDLLGLETTFTSFDTEVVEDGSAGEATVKATLNLVSPYEVTFSLSNETGNWQISRIQPQTEPVDHSGG